MVYRRNKNIIQKKKVVFKTANPMAGAGGYSGALLWRCGWMFVTESPVLAPADAPQLDSVGEREIQGVYS